ncbi:MAG: aminotransferase class I/II-fold pyridoxal phosphate-dependent enzyme [Polyangiaceae bacterium]|nr:aminotransferase class I/II-fold pyridoxal phosphate-dependent enzyme [Polyangiaceae bacterium]
MGPAERARVLDAFDSNWIAPLGPHVDAFEREMAAHLGVAHAGALSSGTAALHLALRLLGVGPGDEVVASDLTFAATVNPIVYQGASPVLIDSERSTWNMDANLLEQELREAADRGALPKAVVVTDLYGQCADYDALVPLCARYDVPLIEDAAEALGATWQGKPAGSFGMMAAFSFNGNKIITTSGGGMLVSNDGALIARARHLATQAREPAPHYQHEEVGYNYRLSNLLAAVGRGQLEVLQERVGARRRNARLYREALGDIPGVSFIPEEPRGRPNSWLTVVQLDPAVVRVSREAVRLALEAEDIESRPVWKPMHLQPVYRTARCRGGAVGEEIFERGLCLPSGSSLTDEERARVVAAFRRAVGAA